MNFFRRAIANITRKPVKTIILLLLVFVLGNVIAGAVTIEQSIRNTEESVTKGMTPVATVEIDYRKEIDWDNMKYLSVDQIEKLGALPSVAFFDYADQAGLQTTELQRYYDPNQDDYYGTKPMPLPAGDSEDVEVYPSYFTLYGGQSGEILDRKLNKITIVEGREPNESEVSSGKNVVVISKKLADLNKLHVGSTITMTIEIYKYDEIVILKEDSASSVIVSTDIATEPYEPMKPAKILTYEFTVIGLFETTGTSSSNPNDIYYYMDIERQNMIYTSNKAIRNINDAYLTEYNRINPEYVYYQDQNTYYTPIYVLKSNDDLKSFRTDAAGILPNYYKVIDNQSSFANIAAPLKNMSSIATIVLIAGVGASLLILSLLITLLLRERRHEIGIYLSLGERKTKIIGQVLSEVLVISLIAITLALFTGNLLSGILSNSMIENQVIAQQGAEQDLWWGYQEYSTLDYMGYGANITLEELASQYKVTLGSSIILIFYSVGILTVLFSTLVPILYVLRLNPRKILL